MFIPQICRSCAIASLSVVWLFVSSGCSKEEEATIDQALDFAIEEPTEPVTHMELVEDLSEEVADWLLEYSDILKKRDFETARTWLADDFEGQALSPLKKGDTKNMPLGVNLLSWEPDTAKLVGADAFMESVSGFLSSWQRVEQVLWKVKGAEFQSGRRPWGKIKLKIVMT
ncbi:MAG: hypothetical protein GY930_12700, partial [bacterium]|nr:hypothetical protein [bacterium]